MKTTILVSINMVLAVSFENGTAQNMVPNPSFENHTVCPASYGELYKCENWSSFGYSPDYFNACSPDTIVNVPQNEFGFQF